MLVVSSSFPRVSTSVPRGRTHSAGSIDGIIAGITTSIDGIIGIIAGIIGIIAGIIADIDGIIGIFRCSTTRGGTGKQVQFPNISDSSQILAGGRYI